MRRGTCATASSAWYNLKVRKENGMKKTFKAKFPVFNEEAYLAETGAPLDMDLDQVTGCHPTVTLAKAPSDHPGHIDIIIEAPTKKAICRAVSDFFSVKPTMVGQGGTFEVQIVWI
jgi:hypothetical protein